jgi:GNAT superfamily N-acetyltransferase
MSFAMRHRDDPMPVLPSTHSLSVRREESAGVMATLQERSNGELSRRFDEGHRAYVASMDGEPTAWGWVATRTASIGELGATFSMPESDRYLWNFVTRPSYRGLGIYPRLLQAIVRALTPGGAGAASRMLGLPKTTDELTPCWRCVRAGRPGMSCAAGTCRCDYQRPHGECTA